MTDRDRLRQAYEETFDMNTSPGFRQAVIARAVATPRRRPQLARFAFAAGAAAAVLLIAAVVALLHMPSAPAPSPVGQPSPSPSIAAKTPSAKQLNDVAAAVFAKDPRYGYYVPCDETGNQAACPFTARLQQQLSALKTTACIGCQNPFQNLAITPDAAGGSVSVAGNGYAYDLHVVTVSGRLLVDDITVRCQAQPPGSGVSVYAMRLQTSPAGQYPAPVPACPA